MMMGIDGEPFGGLGPKQGEVVRVVLYRFRRTGTAHMVVEADHLIRRRHDEMQIVRDHQDSAIEAVAQAAGNLAEAPSLELGEALLNQRLVAGIGNIFKSESCFEAGLDPWRAVGALEPDEVSLVLGVAARQMERGVATGRRPGRIYRRTGRPCIRCGERVLSRGQGPESRTTYWCPGCQR